MGSYRYARLCSCLFANANQSGSYRNILSGNDHYFYRCHSWQPIHHLRCRRHSNTDLSPVPANGYVLISGAGAGGGSTVTPEVKVVRLYDVQGRLMRTLNNPVQSNSIRLDVSKVSPGTYFVEIVSGGKKETHKLLIAR